MRKLRTADKNKRDRPRPTLEPHGDKSLEREQDKDVCHSYIGNISLLQVCLLSERLLYGALALYLPDSAAVQRQIAAGAAAASTAVAVERCG